jgi:hypothetical protein
LPTWFNKGEIKFKKLKSCSCALTGLKQVNIHKATGLDGLPGRVLRARAEQLASVFTDIFYLSLTESVIPTCFKQTTTVPVPNIAKATCLNDYHTVALTSVAVKCFERLVMAHINTIIPETLDPIQFAYHPNRSTDDALSIALHTTLSHLDERNTNVRMQLIGYMLSVQHRNAHKAHH